LLDILIEQRDLDGSSLSDLEIASQILAILFGSHETTANLLCSIMVQLEFNPSWREKLRDELKERSLKPTLSSKEDSNLFAYILNECLRINPPIYTIPRKVIKSFEVKNCQVPEGWYIILSPLLTHRLPELYPNPEAFDPLRFSPSRQEHKKHPFAFVSFGGGAHKCLGQDLAMLEVEIIITYLFRNYFWRFHNNLDNSDFLKHTLKRIKSLKISLEN
jgi:retinoid hydroxylase